MQMSVSQLPLQPGIAEDGHASARLGLAAPAGIRIGWVSIFRLTRECMTDVVARAQPSFDILPFTTAADCIGVSAAPLDLIVYHARGHGVSDLQEVTELRRAFAAVKLLVLSDSVTMDPAFVQRILADGASGFILTSTNSLEVLVSAIRLVSSGGTFVSREFVVDGQMSRRSSPRAERRSPQRITPRERTVLELIKRGKPNKIIAYELGLSLCTVKVHMRNLIRKMGATNRTEAAVKADQLLQCPSA
jgi:DNA-binding NarL/FixJ family response regulator